MKLSPPVSLYMYVNLTYHVSTPIIEREMAFTISRCQSAFTEREKENLENIGDKECATREGVISSQLQLKSSLSSKECSSQSMDKHAVLRRIKQRRSYNKAKSALEALIGSSEANNNASALEHKWVQLGDSFSSP